MAKRGRPKTTGESGTIRVPKDIYLMVHWIADALRITTTAVADRFLRHRLATLYLHLLPEIRQRHDAELRAAKMESRDPLPLLDVPIKIPVSVLKLDEHGFPEYVADKAYQRLFPKPADYHPRGEREFPSSELTDEAWAKLKKLRALETPRPPNDDPFGAISDLEYDRMLDQLMWLIFRHSGTDDQQAEDASATTLPPDAPQKRAKKPKK